MIIIVGAGGFLGYSLSRYFSTQKIEFATISRSFQWPSMVFEKRFIGCASDAAKFMSSFTEDLQVLYMAGSPNLALAEQDPVVDLTVHKDEISSFLESYSSLSCNFKRFIFVSSAGTVYGDSHGDVRSEKSELRPKSAYGSRNVALEKTVSSWANHSQECMSIFRVSNPFGPGQFRFRRRGLVQALIDSASSGQKISIRGNGYQKRDYIYSADLCSVVGHLLELKSLPCVINISSGFSYSAREVIQVLYDNRIFPSFEYIDMADAFEVEDSLVSSSKLRSILSLEEDELLPFKANNVLGMCHCDEEEV